MSDFLRRLAGAGWKPHAGQLEYLLNKARFRVLACGRRWGKTDAAAADIAGRIAESKSSAQIAIAPTLAQAKIVFERVRFFLGALGIAFVPYATPYPAIKIFEQGDKKAQTLHVFDARSGHEAKNLRGAGAAHILIDEAAFVPEPLITEVAMPMLAANDGRMTLISTPRGRNFFYRYFALGERSESGFWSRHSPSWENPLVSEEYLRLQKEILSERAFNSEYGAEFLDSVSAAFAPEGLDASLSAPEVPFGEVVVGIDWARCSDYTVVAAVRGKQSRCELIAIEQWNRIRWSDQVVRACHFAKRYGARKIVSDATGVGDPVTQELAARIPSATVIEFVFNSQSKSHIVNKLIWLFERGAIRLPADFELLRQLENFEGNDERGRIRYQAAAGFHDDMVCALALACFGLEADRTLGFLSRERKS